MRINLQPVGIENLYILFSKKIMSDLKILFDYKKTDFRIMRSCGETTNHAKNENFRQI